MWNYIEQEFSKSYFEPVVFKKYSHLFNENADSEFKQAIKDI